MNYEFFLDGLAEETSNPELTLEFPTLDFSGYGYLAGELPKGLTTIDGDPTVAEVLVLYRNPGHFSDGEIVTIVKSNVDGTWKVENLNQNMQFDVIGRKNGYNDVIMSRVKPFVSIAPRLAFTRPVEMHIGVPLDYLFPIIGSYSTVSFVPALPGDVTYSGTSFVGLWPTGTPGDLPYVMKIDGVDNPFTIKLILDQLDIITEIPEYFEVGVPIEPIVLEATGGEGPYSWSITDGVLPDGLSLVDGVLSGSLTGSSDDLFTIQVTDIRSNTISRQYRIFTSYHAFVDSLSPSSYWKMDDITSTIIDSGSNMFDGSILGTNVTYLNTPIRKGSSGCLGFGISAAGTGKMTTGQYKGLFASSTSNVTIAFWIKRTNINDSRYNIIFANWINASSGYCTYRVATGTLQIPDNNKAIDAVIDMPIGDVCFIVIVKRTTGFDLYNNGVLIESNSKTNANGPAGEGLTIPGTGDWDYYPIRGYMSDFAIWENKALTQEEVTKLWGLGKL